MKYSLLLSLLLFTGVACAFSDTLSVSPPTQTIYAGQTFTVDIDVDSIPDLFSYQFTLNFDPTVLAADNITEGALFADAMFNSQPDSFFIPGTIDNTTGSIAFTLDTLENISVDGPGTLAIAQFTAISTGAASISFDPNSVLLLDSSLSPIASVTTTSGAVNAAPVAEPATFYLLATALGLMLFGMWKRSQNHRKGGAETIHL